MGTSISDFLMDCFISSVLFISTSYIYFKVSVTSIKKKSRICLIVIFGCVFISVLYAFLHPRYQAFALMLSYLLTPFYYILFEKNHIRVKLLICFFASSFTRVFALILLALLSVVFALVTPGSTDIWVVIAYALVFLSAFLFLRIKRLKNVFRLLTDDKKYGIGLVIAAVVFALIGTVYSLDHLEELPSVVLMMGIFLSGVGLYMWIRHGITARYRERMRQRNAEYDKQRLAEYERELDRMRQSNEFLAKVVHRDNHLIGALNSAVEEYLNSDDKKFRDDLLRELQTLAKERVELIDTEQLGSGILPSTGNRLIDGAVKNLYIKAAAHGIDLSLTVAETVGAIIGKYISQTELQTLICDHIKDAVIAADALGKGGGRILVDLSSRNGDYTITVFDSGVDFEIDTLSRLGRERVTTHADSGGSGIGFMTTFETLGKSCASLIITEYENRTPFTKSVTFCFDGKGAFVISSPRAAELKEKISRPDVVITG